MLETCDVIRNRIDCFLAQYPEISKAAFLRVLAAQIHTAGKHVNFQGKQLTDFMALEGADRGASGKVFYAAYCFFEKLRVVEGR